MRTASITVNLYLATLLGLSLAACKDKSQEQTVDADPAAGSVVPTEAPAAATAKSAAMDAAPESDLVASTNEPFWQAQASGPVMTLRGIEGERQLAISTSDGIGDMRILRATDAGGVVELQVTAAPCRDSMSGAQFPYSAVLVIDGGTPLSGCARPASMPAPGEPQ